MIDKNKTYRTRDGREVRIYATDGEGTHPIHGAIKQENGCWQIRSWCVNGHPMAGYIDNINDLIEVKPRIKRTVWLNIYEYEDRPSTKEEADAFAANHRKACVKVEIDCEEGEGL